MERVIAVVGFAFCKDLDMELLNMSFILLVAVKGRRESLD